ncbi:SGNH hydrolase domain-containing protein [Streptomyces sp. NBC_00536]|uniref:SGNH hydrolase domain-containing protein n=1 Tax=Streptomyces sp. NBC_00536 TaxID=2975769 RepID=UPI002E801152|nr:SGNH hydrolase domain-containing protein [Streptomyces sp. NBC_00536]WUC82897.1 SGNH hydrolase domain-containing protein [Streptomyces sp. NBC_00536]
MPFPVTPGFRRKHSATPVPRPPGEAPGAPSGPPAASGPPPSGSGGESGPSPHRSAFRPDIEGLRAVAVLAVLAFHAGIPGMAGGFVGVDVFFVISGYLITGLLVREAITTGRIRLGDFFSRRARRLLPSAAVVLGAVAVAGAWLTVPLRRAVLEYDVVAAALSFANWRFVSQQTDYLAAGRDQSPLLHFWSLAVEEQFYLFWAPLMAVIALCTARAVRRGRVVRAVVALATLLLALGSFALSLRWTDHSVSLAYLGTPSRVWQFATGALLALLPWHLLRGPRPLRLLCGWAGAVAIGWCVLSYDASTPYPGFAALVPTLGAAAVILAAIPGRGERNAEGAYGVGRLLATRAPRAVGRLSYTLYLWHWPVLVLAEASLGTLGWPAKTALTLAAVLPALATMRWVERPLRRSRTVSELPRRGLSVGVTAIVMPVVLALVVGTTTLRLLGPAAPVDLQGLPPGAASGPTLLARGPAAPPLDGPVVPGPAQAAKDFPPDGNCEVDPAVTRSPDCLFGAVTSPDRIVLLGDSHAGQWFSPMLALASQRGWALQELVKQGCPLPKLAVDNPQLGRAYRECDTWRADALDRLKRQPKPRLVVISSLARYTADPALLAGAWEETLKPLRALGVPVVYIEDTPVPGKDIPACLSGSPGSPDACAFGREAAQQPDALARRIASGALPGVRSISVNPVLCPGAGPTCPAVLDRILLYRDDSHLTNVAAVVLTARLERLLTETGALPAAGAASGAAPGTPSAAAPPAADGWKELLREEFDGPAGSRPSAATWQYDLGTCYPGCPAPQWGTGEIETMTDSTDNVRLDGKGALEIVPTRKDGRWSSGRIETRRADFAPPPGGVLRIEASIALPDVTGPKAAGYWPAFWTLGAPLRNGYTGWPSVGELDVMENVNGRDSVFATLHCGILGGGPCKEPVGLTSGPQPCPDCRTAFHSYAVEVDLSPGAQEVRWLLDGRVYHRVGAAAMDPATWKQTVDHGVFLILNVAVGGSLPLADGATAGPATEPGHPMRVDRVTVSAKGGATAP